jgi:hypothetical protein
VLSHQFVHSAPDGANRNLKALSQIFFVWQGRTWCRRTALEHTIWVSVGFKMGDAIAIPINSANQTRTSHASTRWADTLNMIVIMSETEKRPPLTRAAFGLYINLHLPMASNFFKNQLEHQANRLTFSPDK